MALGHEQGPSTVGMLEALYHLKGIVVMQIPWCNMTFLNTTVK